MKWTALLPLVAFAGCALEDPEVTDVATQPVIDQGCVGVNCPGNSPLYAALGIFELSADPTLSSVRGFSIDQNNVYLQPFGMPAQKLLNFHVDGLTLKARYADGVELGPSQFTDVRVRIKHKSGAQYDLRITNPQTTTYYAPIPDLFSFHAYEIWYRNITDTTSGWKELCPYTYYPDPFDNGIEGTFAVFWRGDRLDPDTGIFYKHGAEVGPWFNISCAGEGPAKVVRTAAMYAAQPSATMVQAQASLDMFTARYCPNTTTRYTHLGTDIEWDDKTGSNVLPQPPAIRYEAIWNGNGAYCLRTPRLPEEEFGSYACVPKHCTDAELASWRSHGEVRSGTEPPHAVIAP